jgi:hypothetical protein
LLGGSAGRALDASAGARYSYSSAFDQHTYSWHSLEPGEAVLHRGGYAQVFRANHTNLCDQSRSPIVGSP